MQDLSRMSDDELRALYAQSQGGPAPVAPSPSPAAPIIVRRANPAPEIRAQAADTRAEAQLALAQAAARRAEEAAARDAAKFARDEAMRGGAGPIALTSEARSTILGQYRGLGDVARGINSLRRQYEQSLAGRNPLEGRVGAMRPQDQVFDNTANGMSANMAGLLMLSGQQFNTPAEQQIFIGSLLPSATDTDEAVIAKLNELEARLATARSQGRTLLGFTPENDILASNPDVAAFERRVAPQRDNQPAGVAIPNGGAGGPPSGPVDPFGQGGPAVLPTARGVRPDAGIGANGVTGDAGGMRVIPELYGLGNEIAGLVQQGATREQVLAHYQSRMQQAGAPISMGQVQVINEVVAKHQQFPNAPVSSLADGWDNFHMQPTGGSVIGQAADTTPGAAIIGAANGFSAGGLRALQGDQGRAVMDYAQAERPISTFVGDAVGTTATMLGANAALGAAGRTAGMFGRGARALTAANGVGADAAYGGLRGAMEANPGNRLAGAGIGALLGGGGNLAGQGLVGAAGAGLRGVTDPSVRYLADRGINMSMGQLLGNRTRAGQFVNKLESLPVVGDMLGARRADSVGDYGRAQLAENLAPIGYTPPAGPYSQDMLAHAQRASGDSYNFLDGRNFSTDQQGIADIGAALNAGRTVPRVGEEFGAIVDRNIGPMFDPNGNFSGQGYQDALQQLRTARSGFSQDGAMGNMAADAASQLEDALNGIVARQAPDIAPQMQAANEAYRGLVPIENASISATNNAGLFTPTQYGRAAVNNTRRFGGRGAAARGDVPGSDLQQAAQDIIPSTIPDSGTVGRALATYALPTALGGTAAGLSTFSDHPVASAGLGALALISTRGGSRLLQRGMIGGAGRQRAGQALLNNRDVAGLLGAGLLIPAYSAAGQ